MESFVGALSFAKYAGAVDGVAYTDELWKQVGKVQENDLRHVEAMLFSQAKTLEMMFTQLVRKASCQEYLQQYQAHLSLGLKAQAQCRATLEALIELKQPRSVAFVRTAQANISQGGPQQVVNGAAPHARAEEKPVQQNELLELTHGGMDGITASSPGAGNPELETVAQGDRTADS